MKKQLLNAKSVCCELCTMSVIVGTIWKVALPKFQNTLIICDVCRDKILYAEREYFDGRE